MRLITLVVGLALCVAVIGLTACGDSGGNDLDAGLDGSTDTDADNDTDSDTDADSDTDTDSDTDSDSDNGTDTDSDDPCADENTFPCDWAWTLCCTECGIDCVSCWDPCHTDLCDCLEAMGCFTDGC